MASSTTTNDTAVAGVSAPEAAGAASGGIPSSSGAVSAGGTNSTSAVSAERGGGAAGAAALGGAAIAGAVIRPPFASPGESVAATIGAPSSVATSESATAAPAAIAAAAAPAAASSAPAAVSAAPATLSAAASVALQTAAQRGAAAASAPTVVVAIGDSIMDGHGMQPDEAWPALVSAQNGWQLDNLSVDGAGFIEIGDDGTTFAAQVTEAAALGPSIVLISGSSNDLGQDDDELSDVTNSAFADLRSALPTAQIIAVSAIWGDTDEPDQLAVINGQVQSASAAVGGSYLDIGEPLFARPDLMQDDDVHPTPEGQQLLADAIEQQLSGLPSP